MKITLVYLAAGSSVRFGEENKLLYEIGGNPMFRCLLDRLLNICRTCPEYELLTVTRFDAIEEYCRTNGITAVHSADSVNGISYSIRAGLEARPDSDAYVFFTADQPYFTEESARKFLSFMKNSASPLGCVSHGGESGNPVWFSRKYRDELLSLSGDRGGKRVMKAHMDECVMYEISDAHELTDVDVK